MTSPFEPPDGLGEHGRRAWDVYTAEHAATMKEVDTLLLEHFCRLMDLLPGLHEKAVSGEKTAMLAFGIGTDKLLAYSAKLGLTPADRAKLTSAATKAKKAEEEAKPKEKPTRPRKSSLDDLDPAKLGITTYVPTGGGTKG